MRWPLLALILGPVATAAGQEIVVDNSDPGFSVVVGDWGTQSDPGAHGDDQHRVAIGVGPTSPATAVCQWEATLPETGLYEVGVWLAAATGTEIVVDNDNGAPGYVSSGTWQLSGSSGYSGGQYWFSHHDDPPSTGTWAPNLPQAGEYEVSTIFRQSTNRSTDVPFTVAHAGTAEVVRIDQSGANSVVEVTLGRFPFNAGTGGSATIGNDMSPGVCISDAVKFTLITKDRPGDAPYTVAHASGESPVEIDQSTGGWISLGQLMFDAGTSARVRLSNACELGAEVTADAVRFTPIAAPPQGELRAMWISRFEWPVQANQAATENTLAGFMQSLADHNFNAAFVQIRGQCDTLYPSPFEPWSPLISSPDGVDPGFDPVEFGVNAAHSRGLQFHAYINTHTCWQTGTPSPSSYPDHIFFQHCNAADPDARDWLIHDEAGLPVQTEESNYVWMAPGVPEMQAHVRQQIMYAVETYDIDGVHFDRIRTPGPEYSHDPISEARWDNPATPTPNDGQGNPDRLGFADWTIDQFTRFNNDIYAQIRAARDDVAVSSAPLGLHQQSDYPGYPAGFQYGVTRAYQDAVKWVQNGGQDFICPQIYWGDGGSLPDFSDLFPVWLSDTNAAGRWLVAGSITSNGLSEIQNHAEIARSSGAFGHIVFSISSTSGSAFDSWLANVYPTPSTPPSPASYPWRSSESVILGRVYQADGQTPVTDAWVTRSGDPWTALSSADGLYAFLRVLPGQYALNAEHPVFGTGTASVTANPGAASEVDIILGAPDSPSGVLLRGP